MPIGGAFGLLVTRRPFAGTAVAASEGQGEPTLSDGREKLPIGSFRVASVSGAIGDSS